MAEILQAATWTQPVMDDGAFGADFKFSPWWWEWAPREDPSEPRLPADAEIAIVGSGFTALNAALTLARAGRQVVVLEADAPGFGASSRNGGQVGSGNQRFTVQRLVELFGEQQAKALLNEGVAALRYVGDLIETERIECHFQRVGRYRGANRLAHYDPMARDLEHLARLTGVEFHMVPQSEQHTELGTDYYHGGSILPEDACLHPALYHRGLLERVRKAGVEVVPNTRVVSLERERQRVALRTTRGELSAGDALVATNGYTSDATPNLQVRIQPVGSAIIATEPLPIELMNRIMPKGRVIGETRRVFYYYRACPERRRVLFGGRTAAIRTHPVANDFRHLYRGMVEIFPELAGTKITHGWTGYTGYTRDTLPHTGKRDGLHYAMGYCGSGVARASYLGRKLGLKLLGDAEGHTAWDEHAFRPFLFPAVTRALLPAAVGWMRLRDAVDL